MTMHGTIMVFFRIDDCAVSPRFWEFLSPADSGRRGGYAVSPRFNMMSFWVTFIAFPRSGLFLLH